MGCEHHCQAPGEVRPWHKLRGSQGCAHIMAQGAAVSLSGIQTLTHADTLRDVCELQGTSFRKPEGTRGLERQSPSRLQASHRCLPSSETRVLGKGRELLSLPMTKAPLRSPNQGPGQQHPLPRALPGHRLGSYLWLSGGHALALHWDYERVQILLSPWVGPYAPSRHSAISKHGGSPGPWRNRSHSWLRAHVGTLGRQESPQGRKIGLRMLHTLLLT